MVVHIFNPENDMALADGKPGYTPPATIQQMRRELGWLPRWWAAEQDIVWENEEPLRLQEDAEIRPWGWSPALIHQLKLAGVQDSLLPTDERMEQLRQLSHRQTAVKALRDFSEQCPADFPLQGAATLCSTNEEVQAQLQAGEPRLMKAPWSSSGKGLMPGTAPHAKEWVQRILRQQGSVVVEKQLRKLADFAMEFELDGQGGVEYQGLSLFYTNEAGAYAGNWVAPEGQKLQWLMQYASPQHLIYIRNWWQQYLARFQYRGPVGVDMMLCPDGICPCIEINWRMTMGRVAAMLSQQGKFGRLVVEYVYGHYSAEVEAFS